MDPSTYTITSQVPSSGRDASGRFVDGIDITITTGKGWIVHRFVPDADYSAVKVKPLLAQLAQEADDIGAGSGS